MNPQELFLADGKSAGVWFCQKCKMVHGKHVLADQCCAMLKARKLLTQTPPNLP